LPRLIASSVSLNEQLNFKLRDSPIDISEKYQSAYGNKLALLEWRRQTGYESSNNVRDAVIVEMGWVALLKEVTDPCIAVLLTTAQSVVVFNREGSTTTGP
jgi:hypothetical protein